MRTLLAVLLIVSSVNAEDILTPTKAELIAIADDDNKAANRDKLISKYDGKLVKVTVAAYLHGPANVVGISSKPSFRAILDHPAAIPNNSIACFIHFGPDTDKIKKEIDDKGTQLKPLIVTLYARLKVGKSGAVTLEGATTIKDNAGKLPEKKK